jgi:hypothetical protein
MDSKIYDKIVLLEVNKHKTSDIPSTTKCEFEYASIEYSGNFMIVCIHDKLDTTKMICRPFNISDVKSYKIN